jgi:hypothetical protein
VAQPTSTVVLQALWFLQHVHLPHRLLLKLLQVTNRKALSPACRINYHAASFAGCQLRHVPVEPCAGKLMMPAMAICALLPLPRSSRLARQSNNLLQRVLQLCKTHTLKQHVPSGRGAYQRPHRRFASKGRSGYNTRISETKAASSLIEFKQLNREASCFLISRAT